MAHITVMLGALKAADDFYMAVLVLSYALGGAVLYVTSMSAQSQCLARFSFHFYAMRATAANAPSGLDYGDICFGQLGLFASNGACDVCCSCWRGYHPAPELPYFASLVFLGNAPKKPPWMWVARPEERPHCAFPASGEAELRPPGRRPAAPLLCLPKGRGRWPHARARLPRCWADAAHAPERSCT